MQSAQRLVGLAVGVADTWRSISLVPETGAPPKPRASHAHLFFSGPLRGAKSSGAAACEGRALAAAKKRANPRATLSRLQRDLESLAAPPRSTKIIHFKVCEAPRSRRGAARRSHLHRAPSLTLLHCRSASAPANALTYPPRRSSTAQDPRSPARALPPAALLRPPADALTCICKRKECTTVATRWTTSRKL